MSNRGHRINVWSDPAWAMTSAHRGMRMRLVRTAAVVAVMLGASAASAQSGWLERMDANRNGYIEPSELSDRARSYMERFARDYGLDLSRPNSVRRIEEAANRYNERRSRDEQNQMAEINVPSIPGFGAVADKPLVPGFGSPQIRYPYTAADLQEADDVMRRYDSDRDGYIAGPELERVPWRDQSAADSDLDRDGRLSRIEMAQRYARRRIMAEREAQLQSLQAPAMTSSSNDNDDRDSDSWRYDRRMRGEDRGSRYLAYSVIERYDLNKDNSLDQRELARAGIEIGEADFDRDGLVSSNELGEYLLAVMNREGENLSELLPTWFFEQDRNNDRQIAMDEFTDEWTEERLAEFNAYDTNGDGIIVANEILTSKSVVGGGYSSEKAMVLLPRSVVASEIEIDEPTKIGSLSVRLSITHTYADHLDAYLTGPDGQRIELFSHVGGSDDHFDRTVFDDTADTNITRARAPFTGRFQPSAMARREKSLSAFKGLSAKGIWQLTIRSSRSDRSGILHNWALIVTPDRDSVDQLRLDVTSAEPDSTAPNSPSATPTNPIDAPRESFDPARSRADFYPSR